MKNKLVVIMCLMLCAVILFSACRKEAPQKTKEPLSSVNNTLQTTTSPSATTETTTSTTTPKTTTTTKNDTSIITTTPKTATTKSPSKTTSAKTTVKTTPKVTTTTTQKKELIVPNASQIAVIENEVVRLVNEYRVANGVTKLTVEPKLTQGARIRAKECSTTGNFGHERPDGSSGISVLTDVKYGTLNTFQEYVDGEWVDRAEYGAGPAAENLDAVDSHIIGQNYFNCTSTELKMVAQEMFDGWKNSTSGHRENMLNSNYTKFGMGIYALKEAYKSGEIVMCCYGIQLFTAE